MAEIVKKATRESFGLALVEEGKTNPTLLHWIQTWRNRQRQAFLRMPIRTVSSNAALRKQI